MDFLYSGAIVHSLSTGAAALYQQGATQQHLLGTVFGLCCNALSLSTELFARRHHCNPPETRNAHCGRQARSNKAPISFEVWTYQGTWFWHAVSPQRNGGAIGAATSQTEAIREARSAMEELSRLTPTAILQQTRRRDLRI